jgi:hypothetical protein
MENAMNARPMCLAACGAAGAARRVASLLTLALLLLPGTALGQSEEELPAPRTRLLNGHKFIPSARLPSPFITTEVNNSTGAGKAFDVETVLGDFQGNPVVLTGDVTFLGVGFGYQQAVTDWFAASVAVGGFGRLGSEVESVLAQGVSTGFNFDLGTKFRLWRNERFFLSANLALASTSLTFVNVLDWARRVVETRELTDSLLVATGESSSFRGGVQISYAPAAWLGLTGSAETGVGNAFGDNPTDLLFQGSIMADVDLDPVNGWPIGFFVAFDRNSFSNQGSDLVTSTNSFSYGIFYTRPEDFSIGLEWRLARLKQVETEAKLDANSVNINFRYWF